MDTLPKKRITKQVKRIKRKENKIRRENGM
jgi:hypothetical protein